MWLNELLGRCLRRSSTGQRITQAAARHRQRVQLSLERLDDRALPSTYTASTVSDLIADINAANLAGGSNTITLQAHTSFTSAGPDNATDGGNGLPVIAASDNVTIIGNGDTIQNTGTARFFEVAAGASLTLQNLTLQGGFLRNASGGAIYNLGALDLNDVTVQNNMVRSQAVQNSFGYYVWLAPAMGGGIYSSGVLTLEGGTKVQNNQALGGNGVPHLAGGSAYGGGVYIAGGTAAFSNATISSNTAQGGVGNNGYFIPQHTHLPGTYVLPTTGGSAYGGGVFAGGATVTLDNTNLTGNITRGGQGGAGIGPERGAGGGTAQGGGLDGYGVTMRNDTVTNNSAQGGLPGAGPAGLGSPGAGNGGGLSVGGVYLDAFTVAHVIHNTASTSDPDIFGSWTPI